MKKNLLMAVAAAAVMLTSCKKEDVVSTDNKQTVLSVKVSSAKLNTRGQLSDPVGASYRTPLINGVIFILDASGSVTKAVTIETGAGANGIESTEGQKIEDVAHNAKVYVVGNIDPQLATEWVYTDIPANLNEIHAKTLDINGLYAQGTNSLPLITATLANHEGVPAGITLGSGTGGAAGTNDGEASVNVLLTPTITRVEIGMIEGMDRITDFTVEGVYIDRYYPQYTILGTGAGTMYEHGVADDFTGYEPFMAIETSVNTKGTTSNSIFANPGNNEIWGFNLAPETAPYIIVKLENVTGTTTAGGAIPISTYYLTVKTYAKNGNPITHFERGKVYRLNSIVFNQDDIATTPNPLGVDLWVTVDVAEWEFEDITGGL